MIITSKNDGFIYIEEGKTTIKISGEKLILDSIEAERLFIRHADVEVGHFAVDYLDCTGVVNVKAVTSQRFIRVNTDQVFRGSSIIIGNTQYFPKKDN